MKPGKQTEVGDIPDDWIITRIGDIATVKDGTHQTPRYVPVGIPFYSVEHVTSGNFDDTKFITVDEHKFLTRSFRMERGDVLMTRIGSIGDCKLIDWDVDASFYVSLALLKIHGASPVYFEQYSKTHSFKREVELHSLASAIPRKINLGPISDVKIVLPPPAEQSAIATALSDVDTLLSSLDALISKKRDIKQAAMQQLLTGKARLPGFEEGWTVKRLDQLASIRSGGTPSTTVSRFWDGGIPWCTPTDITRLGGGKYLLDTSRQITPEGLSNSSAELIPANSVVMTSRATIGECAINLKPVTTNQGFKNFVPFEDTDVSFLYYLLQTQRQGFIQLCSGSTFLEIGKTQLAAYKVHLPSTKVEQTAIAEVLSDMDAELAALEARRDKTRLLKQGMMQELLTGKTRLV
jgi:type I restriction enzyme S subunit